MNALKNQENVVSLEFYRNKPQRVVEQNSIGALVASGVFSSPPWERSVIDQLGKLLELRLGWDGADAKPLEEGTVRYAFGLLHYVWPSGTAPKIVPTCYGGLQFEWRLQDMDLEIEIVRQHQIQGLLIDEKESCEISFECKHDLSELFVALEKFKEREKSTGNAIAAA